MKKLVHHSPLGDLEIPIVPGPVAPGDPFEVSDDIAASLLLQSDLYSAVAPRTVAELRALAKDRGVDITGLKQAEDIEAALAAAEQEESK